MAADILCIDSDDEKPLQNSCNTHSAVSPKRRKIDTQVPANKIVVGTDAEAVPVTDATEVPANKIDVGTKAETVPATGANEGTTTATTEVTETPTAPTESTSTPSSLPLKATPSTTLSTGVATGVATAAARRTASIDKGSVDIIDSDDDADATGKTATSNIGDKKANSTALLRTSAQPQRKEPAKPAAPKSASESSTCVSTATAKVVDMCLDSDDEAAPPSKPAELPAPANNTSSPNKAQVSKPARIRRRPKKKVFMDICIDSDDDAGTANAPAPPKAVATQAMTGIARKARKEASTVSALSKPTEELSKIDEELRSIIETQPELSDEDRELEMVAHAMAVMTLDKLQLSEAARSEKISKLKAKLLKRLKDERTAKAAAPPPPTVDAPVVSKALHSTAGGFRKGVLSVTQGLLKDLIAQTPQTAKASGKVILLKRPTLSIAVKRSGEKASDSSSSSTALASEPVEDEMTFEKAEEWRRAEREKRKAIWGKLGDTKSYDDGKLTANSWENSHLSSDEKRKFMKLMGGGGELAELAAGLGADSEANSDDDIPSDLPVFELCGSGGWAEMIEEDDDVPEQADQDDGLPEQAQKDNDGLSEQSKQMEQLYEQARKQRLSGKSGLGLT